MARPSAFVRRSATLAAIGLVFVLGTHVQAAEFQEVLRTPPIDTLAGQCAVTNVSDRDLRVVIRVLDRLGRTHRPGSLLPRLVQMSTDEVIRDADGFIATELDIVLQPLESDGVSRGRIPGPLEAPTRCEVSVETKGAALVSYCKIEEVFDFSTISGCVQAP